ncbi:mannosyl oligosaccharide glucosidase, partial [Opisthorchis viverrini]
MGSPVCALSVSRLVPFHFRMPKGKVIEVRPKKRKSGHRPEEPSTPTESRQQKRDHDHTSHSSVDRIRLTKSKGRSHGEKHFLGDLPFSGKLQKRMFLGTIVACLMAAIVSIAFQQYTKWHRAYLVKTPLDSPKIVSDDSSSQELFWGSYRPGLYFGMKHRSPRPLMVGLIWTIQDYRSPRFRHLCDPNDGVLSYNWLEHDGRRFGTQQIVDLDHIITVSFVKQNTGATGGDWTIRISAAARNQTHSTPPPLSIIVYLYYTEKKKNYYFVPLADGDAVRTIKGTTVELGEHQIHFHSTKRARQTSFYMTHIPSEDAVMQSLYSGLGVRKDTNMLTLIHRPEKLNEDVFPNAFFHEVSVDPPVMTDPFEAADPEHTVLEIEFTQSGRSGGFLVGRSFTEQLASLSADFHKRFAQRFPANLSKVAVSNLLGGIGYFYGHSLIQSPHTGPEPVEGWSAPLFTATPSRSMFPRGFLWDEGFHGLVLARWDPELAMETVGHWLDLMNGDGWIAREQILGPEARSRVPAQFVVQHDSVANPPTLVLVIEALIESIPRFTADEAARFRHWSTLVLPRLHKWYQWFNRTQAGPVPLSYRWRGRDPKAIHQLNPLTLSSGFDDFPRASHPTDSERHLDLRCWMTVFARTVSRLASLVGQYLQTESGASRLQRLEEARTLATHYGRWADLLSNMANLDELHWSEVVGRYADYGLHTDAVRLEVPETPAQLHQTPPLEPRKPVRVIDKPPALQLVTSSYGYLNLFPLLLRIIPPTSPRLPRLMADLSNRDLWTDFGIRSLAASTAFYRKPNTPQDPPYWRGAIWINMNYLAVRALRYYATNPKTPADIAVEASRLSGQLAQNLARTVLGELERTGFLWEQFDDSTGRGQRGHPFAGWTTLISLILTE